LPSGQYVHSKGGLGKKVTLASRLTSSGRAVEEEGWFDHQYTFVTTRFAVSRAFKGVVEIPDTPRMSRSTRIAIRSWKLNINNLVALLQSGFWLH